MSKAMSDRPTGDESWTHCPVCGAPFSAPDSWEHKSAALEASDLARIRAEEECEQFRGKLAETIGKLMLAESRLANRKPEADPPHV